MIKTSKGEQKIINLLHRGGIQFKREVSFSDLHGARDLLRYDFGIYRNGRLVAFIENDGIQHFQYTPFFHKNKFGFQRQKEMDIKKNKYCLLRHIPLIRVPYWEIDNLTLQKLFNTPEWVVKDKYHNINLIEQGVRK